MLQDSPAARQFIDKLIESKAFHAGLDEEVKEQLRNDLLESLSDDLNRAIVESLPTDQVLQLERLIDTNQVDKIQEFLYKQGINVQALVARVMSEFQASYLKEN